MMGWAKEDELQQNNWTKVRKRICRHETPIVLKLTSSFDNSGSIRGLDQIVEKRRSYNIEVKELQQFQFITKTNFLSSDTQLYLFVTEKLELSLP